MYEDHWVGTYFILLWTHIYDTNWKNFSKDLIKVLCFNDHLKEFTFNILMSESQIIIIVQFLY